MSAYTEKPVSTCHLSALKGERVVLLTEAVARLERELAIYRWPRATPSRERKGGAAIIRITAGAETGEVSKAKVAPIWQRARRPGSDGEP